MTLRICALASLAAFIIPTVAYAAPAWELSSLDGHDVAQISLDDQNLDALSIDCLAGGDFSVSFSKNHLSASLQKYLDFKYPISSMKNFEIDSSSINLMADGSPVIFTPSHASISNQSDLVLIDFRLSHDLVAGAKSSPISRFVNAVAHSKMIKFNSRVAPNEKWSANYPTSGAALALAKAHCK